MCFSLDKNRQSALPCTPHQRGKNTHDSSPGFKSLSGLVTEWAERSHWWCFCKFSVKYLLILPSAHGNTTKIVNKLLIYLFYVEHCAVSLLLAATCMLVQPVNSRHRKSGLPRSLDECGLWGRLLLSNGVQPDSPVPAILAAPVGPVCESPSIM